MHNFIFSEFSMTFPTRKELDKLFTSEQECIQYLMNNDVFYRTFKCPTCEKDMNLKIKKKVFRCPGKRCGRRQFSMKKFTFFFNARLKCINIMRLAHLWLSGATTTTARLQSGLDNETISNYYSHFRQLVGSSITEQDTVIGGPGVVIEIDETKLGKRKYNRGHRVDGVWVLAGIERTEAARTFLVPLPDRKGETLLNFISKHVLPGSIIHTDCWRGYENITKVLGFEHITVNHSLTFKNTETGGCTNTVEGLNNGLKMKIPARNRTEKHIEAHLSEYIWRKNNKLEIWNAFIKALADIHYELE